MDKTNARRWLQRNLDRRAIQAMGPEKLNEFADDLVILLERPVPRKEIAIQFSLRLPFQLHKACVNAAHAAGTPINKWMIAQLEKAFTK